MRIRIEHDSCDLNLLELLDLTARNIEPRMDTNESVCGLNHRKPLGHIQAKSFDTLALLGGSLLQPRQVHGLQSWCSVGDNVERAP